MTSRKQNPLLTNPNVLVFSDALTFVERVPSWQVFALADLVRWNYGSIKEGDNYDFIKLPRYG